MNINNLKQIGKEKKDVSDYIQSLVSGNVSPDDFCKITQQEHDLLLKNTIKNSQIVQTIHNTLERYMELSAEDIKLLTLWILGTYFHSLFQHYPYIYLNAPKGSGKSKLIKIVTWSSYRGVISTNLSMAALYNLIDSKHCTVGFDESEILSDKEKANDITNILLGGFERGNKVYRMPKANNGVNELKEYDIFCPKMIGNIKGLSNDALESRCIPISVVRTLDEKKANEYPNKLDEVFRGVQINCLLLAFEKWDDVKDGLLRISNEGLVGRSFNLFKPLLVVCKMFAPKWYDGFLSYAREKVEEIEENDFSESQELMILESLKSFIEEMTSEEVKFGVSAKDLKQRIELLCFDSVEQKWLTFHFISRLLKRLGLGKDKRRRREGVLYFFNRAYVLSLFERYCESSIVSNKQSILEEGELLLREYLNSSRTLEELSIFMQSNPAIFKHRNVIWLEAWLRVNACNVRSGEWKV